jgi:hypothetical protein
MFPTVAPPPADRPVICLHEPVWTSPGNTSYSAEDALEDTIDENPHTLTGEGRRADHPDQTRLLQAMEAALAMIELWQATDGQDCGCRFCRHLDLNWHAVDRMRSNMECYLVRFPQAEDTPLSLPPTDEAAVDAEDDENPHALLWEGHPVSSPWQIALVKGIREVRSLAGQWFLVEGADKEDDNLICRCAHCQDLHVNNQMLELTLDLLDGLTATPPAGPMLDDARKITRKQLTRLREAQGEDAAQELYERRQAAKHGRQRRIVRMISGLQGLVESWVDDHQGCDCWACGDMVGLAYNLRTAYDLLEGHLCETEDKDDDETEEVNHSK